MTNSIEKATSFDTTIEIITRELVQIGIRHLQNLSLRIPNRVIVSIKEAGIKMGDDLANPGHGIHLIPNPMQMSHRNEHGGYLPIPRLVSLPDINQIIDTHTRQTRPVVFAEAVTETKETIIAATAAIIEQLRTYNNENISHFPNPIFYTYALINKISGLASIPNLEAAFTVDKMIWVAGYWCDDGGKGRDLLNIVGRLADNYEYVPPGPPYYTQNF
ncbi:MAG: hypothetical protein ABII21_02325 [bacterium]